MNKELSVTADNSNHPLRVALAVNEDGTELQHFGHAERFAIYEITPSQVEAREVRQSSAFCRQEEKDRKLENAADLLSDCRLVICKQIGPCAREELALDNVEALEYDGPLRDAVRAVGNPRFTAWLRQPES